MRSPKTRLSIYLCAYIFLVFGASQCHAGTLYGGVTHSDFLTPVEQPQQPQTNFAPQQAIGSPVLTTPTFAGAASRATLQTPDVQWFPIPKWMAGKWTKKGDTTTSVTDLRTGITTPMNQYIEDLMTVTWGYQTDSQGNVWHANLVPSERTGVSQGKSVSFTIINVKILEATPENLALRTHYIVRESIGTQVADMFQQEALAHYALAGSDRKMDVQSSNRVFTYQGRPQRDGQLISHYTKTEDYEPLATKQGIDLAASLNQYLRSHNMAGLAK